MIIHNVRKPFMCREGQFNEGQRELCVGLDYGALKSTNTFICYIGKNKKTYYEIPSARALEIGQQWKNPKGKLVIIVPVKEFAKSSKWNKEEYQEKEIKRGFIIHDSLFGRTYGSK